MNKRYLQMRITMCFRKRSQLIKGTCIYKSYTNEIKILSALLAYSK